MTSPTAKRFEIPVQVPSAWKRRVHPRRGHASAIELETKLDPRAAAERSRKALPRAA